MARKKTTTKKKTTKRKKKTIFSNKKIVYTVLVVVFIFIAGGAFIGGYYLAKTSIEKNTTKQHKKVTNHKNIKDIAKLEELLEQAKHQNNTAKTHINKVNKIEKKQNKNLINSEAIDYQENIHNIKQKNKPTTKPIIYTNKPKLVIIMDDMSFASQVRALKKLDIKVTPSFFPPSNRHPNTAKYAKEFSHYMVHFPMQATNPNFHEEINTLHINSTQQFIDNRVKFIKKEFPNVKFVNNHTGSKFTSNYQAMNRLYIALDRYNLIFIDSRTTSKTKAPLLAQKYHKLLLSRDVFLDNKPDIAYIQKQLRQAIRIAKKRGYAIAICHPHPKTFQALARSKYMLKNVKVIYIDELYRDVKTNKLSRL